MFRPRHAYRSPVTSRYRGKTKGCPVFNNITSINASMVEQHDECLECLAKIKNRSDLYMTLADNKKPRNNVIKSLQRLSSSASNNRLKTCLQFLIIKVNEKSNPPTTFQQQHQQASATTTTIIDEAKDTTYTSSKLQQISKQLISAHDHHKQTGADDHNNGDEDDSFEQQTVETSRLQTNTKRLKLHNRNRTDFKQKHHHEPHQAVQDSASPPQDQVSSTQDQVVPTEEPGRSLKHPIHDEYEEDQDDDDNNNRNHHKHPYESLSTKTEADWNPSPLRSMSPSSSISSSSSLSSSNSSSTASSSSSSSSSTSQSPLSSPDIINGLRSPRLKLSEGKIRKIKKRPIILDDYFTEHSIASTPTTSSACSPRLQQQQHSSSLVMNNNIHMFQAPPKFINTLKPCKLPIESTPTDAQSTPAKETMLNCAICGIKDRPPSISKIYGQNSCLLCTKFFASFLKRPQQLYCAQDGDCLMTFDSRCQACWIKICLQKFNIEDHRKIGHKYSPRLLSSPYVTLITIDTSET